MWASTLFVVLSVGTAGLAAEWPADVRRAVDLHVAGRGAVRTSHCLVDFRIDSNGSGGEQVCQAECWHSPRRVRVKVNDDGRRIDYVWGDAVRRSLYTEKAGGRDAHAGGVAGAATPYYNRGDSWRQGMLALTVPGTVDHYLLEAYLERASAVKLARNGKYDGRELPVIRADFAAPARRGGDWRVDVWLDPSVNYLVRRVVRTAPQLGLTSTEEVVRYAEPQPGVFFPSETTGVTKFDGKPEQNRSRAVMTKISLNTELPDSVFRLTFPPGTRVADAVRGTHYGVDPAGNRTSAESPLTTRPTPLPATDVPPVDMAPTTVEPASRLPYWLFGLGTVLLGGAAAVFCRARKHP